MKAMNRRDFLKKTGKIAFASGAIFGLRAGFSGSNPIKTELALGEDSNNKYNVFNAINPNVKTIQSHTYKDCLSQNYGPGIIYKTTKPMVAVAKGTITRIMELPTVSTNWAALGGNPEGAEGLMIQITHGRDYRSSYFHLKQLDFKFADKVERGQRIGFPDDRWNIARLLFMEGRANAMDPDNFGTNHSFMTYWDGVTDLNIIKEEQDKKLEYQKQLLYKLAELYSGPEKYTLLRKKHRSKDGIIFNWSTIEKFRYIEYLQQNKPETFPSLTKEHFGEMKKEFYSNQPIILTLPFKKG
jgi:hypothetical protein